MNRKLRTTSMLCLLALAAAALSACSLTVSTGPEGQPQRSISVTGDGYADVQPDIATAQIGVQTRDRDAGAAVEANNELAGAVIAAIKALGVAQTDILTANFSVYAQSQPGPVLSPEPGAAEQVTYVVDNSVIVTLRDLSRVGPVLDAAIGAGANSIQGVTFGVEDQSAGLKEARDRAMADARARAEQIAKATGVKLGKVTALNESRFGGPAPQVMALREGVGGGAVQSAPAPVSPGAFRVQLQVNVTYEIGD
ncbi:MAG: SIMPL domain-containing protein [Chloroflexi bacterium]|nr:SIMPL domain-containing protein [Chloroflexota bacterium]